MKKKGVKYYLIYLLPLFISLSFVLAALLKLKDLPLFEHDIYWAFSTIVESKESLSIRITSRVLIILELLLGLLIWQRTYLKSVILPTLILLLLTFSIYLLGIDPSVENCGCFGAVPMSPQVALYKNIFMIILSVIYWKNVNNLKLLKHRNIIPLISVVIITSVLFITAYRKPPAQADGILNQFLPPVEADKVPMLDESAGESKKLTNILGEKPITNKATLLAILSASCEHCRELAGQLAKLSSAKKVNVLFAFHGDSHEVESFLVESNSESIEWISINATTFFQNIDEFPPRLYLFKNRKLIKCWDPPISIDTVKRNLSDG